MNETDKIMNALLFAAMLGSKQDKDKETPKIDGDAIRKQSEDVGNAYYHVYEGFKDAGFADHQAFQLLIETIRRH